MDFDIIRSGSVEHFSLKPAHVYVIGYSGSNTEKTMAHIKELEEHLGVAPPKQIPTIFEVARETLSQDTDLHFVGEKTSGECEYVMVFRGSKLYIGLGSDHTDRELEAVSVLKSKQVCIKPISWELWDYEDIKDHFGEIKLNSKADGKDYQIGSLSDIMSPEAIIKELNERVGNVDNCIIFSGTVPLVDGYEYPDNFYLELVDEVLDRKISFNYYIKVITEQAR